MLSSASSKLSNRLRDDDQLRYDLERDVAGAVAEQLIRLRKYRGWTQEEVAAIAGTAQSGIARHESAASNMRCSSVEQLAKALRGVVRIELIPEEHDYLLRRVPRWWEILYTMARAESAEAKYSFNIVIRAPHTFLGEQPFSQPTNRLNAASVAAEFADWFEEQ